MPCFSFLSDGQFFFVSAIFPSLPWRGFFRTKRGFRLSMSLDRLPLDWHQPMSFDLRRFTALSLFLVFAILCIGFRVCVCVCVCVCIRYSPPSFLILLLLLSAVVVSAWPAPGRVAPRLRPRWWRRSNGVTGPTGPPPSLSLSLSPSLYSLSSCTPHFSVVVVAAAAIAAGVHFLFFLFHRKFFKVRWPHLARLVPSVVAAAAAAAATAAVVAEKKDSPMALEILNFENRVG